MQWLLNIFILLAVLWGHRDLNCAQGSCLLLFVFLFFLDEVNAGFSEESQFPLRKCHNRTFSILSLKHMKITNYISLSNFKNGFLSRYLSGNSPTALGDLEPPVLLGKYNQIKPGRPWRGIPFKFDRLNAHALFAPKAKPLKATK